jgi:hypothetical protein
LLEAAARGGPVLLPDGAIESVDESLWLSLLAARARIVLFEELQRQHRLDMPLTAADRALSHALDWVGVAAALGSDEEGFAAWVSMMNAVGDAADADRAVPTSMPEDLLAAWRFAPESVSSLLAFNWSLDVLDLAVSQWLAETTLGLKPTFDLEALDAHRRLLGIPIGLTDMELAHARATGTLPTHHALGGANIDASLFRAIDAAHLRRSKRYLVIAPGWVSPGMVLR